MINEQRLTIKDLIENSNISDYSEISDNSTTRQLDNLTTSQLTMAKQQNKGYLLRLDPEMMEQVVKWAAHEIRSVNVQIQWIIAESLKRHRRSNKENNDTQD